VADQTTVIGCDSVEILEGLLEYRRTRIKRIFPNPTLQHRIHKLVLPETSDLQSLDHDCHRYPQGRLESVEAVIQLSYGLRNINCLLHNVKSG